jgi:hypothetical protein
MVGHTVALKNANEPIPKLGVLGQFNIAMEAMAHYVIFSSKITYEKW